MRKRNRSVTTYVVEYLEMNRLSKDVYIPSAWFFYSEHDTPQKASAEIQARIDAAKESQRRYPYLGHASINPCHWRVVIVTRSEAYRRRAW
jgi:hypothetical protein